MHFKQAAAGPWVWDYCSGVAGLLCGACAVPGTEWPPGILGPRAAGLPVLQGCAPAACCLPDSKQVQEGQSTGRMLESAATPAKPCPQLERQQELSSCGATMASWTFAAGSSSLQPAARASALCCQSIGPKQQRWKTCTHHLAGCMHPCPWTCRSAPPHPHCHKQCWPALRLASQQQLEVPTSCDQHWGPQLCKSRQAPPQPMLVYAAARLTA